jgi:hypothetical protein
MTRLVIYNTHPKINNSPYNTQIKVTVMDLTCYPQHRRRPHIENHHFGLP